MGSKFRRWRQRRGLASVILGLFASALLLVAGIGIFTYQQMVATRQVVTQTATAALRAAVPQGFVGETLATSTSTQAAGLTMSATAYDQAVGQILPQFWPGSQVTPCTATPAGSPVACTAGQSYLVTLPAVTARALHIAGPLVVANIQVAVTPPYTLTHFGQTTTAPGPVVAADVAVPLHVSLGAVLTLRPWVETAITNVLYADQGGTTAAGSRFLPFAHAPSTTTSTTPSRPQGFCWTYPDSATPACATAPAWTALCTAPPSATHPCSLVVAADGALSVKSYQTIASTGFWATIPVPPADASDFPWLPSPSTACWVRTGTTSWARTGTPGGASCVTPPTTAPWATAYQQSSSAAHVLSTVTTTTTTCVAGDLPSASGSGAVTAVLCASSTSSTGTGGGGITGGGCPAGEIDVNGTCTRTTLGGGGGGHCLSTGTCISTGPVTTRLPG